MRLGIISDIHSNFEALRALATPLLAADKVVCLGDIVGYYCQPREVIEYMMDLNALCILGNHDDFLLRGLPPDTPTAVRFGVEFADQILDAEHRRWLTSLPLVWGGIFDRRSFLLTHGSPWNPLGHYVYNDSTIQKRLADFDYDMIAVGQTHRTAVHLGQRPWLLNPGSVGQSRDLKAVACALIVDTETLTINRIEKPYDPAIVIRLAKENGAGEWITKHLL